MNLKEYCGNAADVLRASERMVQGNVKIWRQTPESDGEYFDPEWRVSLSQADIASLLRNLTDTANLFEILAGSKDAATDLLAAHIAEQIAEEVDEK